MEKQILKLLANGPMPVADIAKKLGMTHYATIAVINRMAGAGLVKLPPKGKHIGVSLVKQGGIKPNSKEV